MNKENINQQIQELESKLAELKSEVNKPKEIKRFPQEGERYWYFQPTGEVSTSTCRDNKGRVPVYKTKEEAFKARDIAFAKDRLNHAIEVANDGWTPDWGNDSQKYLFRFVYMSSVTIDNWSSPKYHPNWMYMKSYKIAQDILSKHEADIKLILGE